jgi:hypothetical protein
MMEVKNEYQTSAIPTLQQTNKAMYINESHSKFGHFSEEMLRRFVHYDGYELTGTFKPCEACTLHKANWGPIPKVASFKATGPDKRLYMDTSGPLQYTLGRDQY